MHYPQPYLQPIDAAIYKQQPADFEVTENLSIEHTGQGEHLWLHLTKTGINTAHLAKLLAMWADVPMRDVGYSGKKDRHAITHQWFSIRLPKQQLPQVDLMAFIQPHLRDDECVTLNQQHWHHRKLATGTHKSNQFDIILRHVCGNRPAIDETLHQLKQTGVPNYFGEQRFGHDDNNIAKAQRFFEKIIQKDSYRPNKRFAEQDGLMISVARSVLFNKMLAKRVELGNWNHAICGDIFNLNGTGSIFEAMIDDDIRHRLHTGDIHLTAPLYGVGDGRHTADVQQMYQAIIDDECHQVFKAGLDIIGTKIAQRPLRLMVSDLSWQWLDEQTLQLSFCLPKGGFATVVLAALVKQFTLLHAQDTQTTP